MPTDRPQSKSLQGARSSRRKAKRAYGSAAVTENSTRILRLAQLGFNSGTRWRDTFGQPLVPDTVHPGEVRIDVLQVNRHRQDAGLVGTGQVQQALDVIERLAGLLFDTRCHVVTHLPGKVNGAVVGDDLAHALIGELALY
jgi:hypothetical protein